MKTELEISCTKLFKWLRENHTKSNTNECHVLVTIRNPVRIDIEGHINYNSTEEKLLGVEIDLQLLYESHVSKLYKKASKKLHALSKNTNYKDLEKRQCLMKT